MHRSAIATSLVAYGIALFFGSFLLCLGLYWRGLDAFFIGDQLSHTAIAVIEASGWRDSLKPMSNGFWRPEVLMATRALVLAFGPAPLPFHLAAVFVNAMVACLTGLYCFKLSGSRIGGIAATMLFTFNIATWHGGSDFCNAADTLAALWLLAALILWETTLSRGEVRGIHVAGLLAFQLAALGAKETGMALGPGLLLICVLDRRAVRRHWIVAAALFAFCAIWAVASAFVVRSHTHTYIAERGLDLNPIHVGRQLIDYLTSALIPYLHVMEAPFVRMTLSHAVLWGIRAIALALIIWFVVTAWRKPESHHRLALFGLSILPLLPAIVLPGPPVGRYLYPSLCFTSILLADMLITSRSKLLKASVLALQAWMLAGFYFSGTVTGYLYFANQTRELVVQMKEHAQEWPTGSTISILDHPHPAAPEYRWVYAQHLVRIFVPETKVTIALERTPKAHKTYRFEHCKLVEAEHAKPQLGTRRP